MVLVFIDSRQLRMNLRVTDLCEKLLRLYSKCALELLVNIGVSNPFSRFQDIPKAYADAYTAAILGRRHYGTDLVDTLQVFLYNNCNVKETADQLYIHKNTMLQRKNKIEEVLGYSPYSMPHMLNMYIAAHVCYGVNPNAKLEGCTTEDERLWGSTQWGFGHQGTCYSGGAPRNAVSHIDGICKDCTIYLDGEMIVQDGVYIHPELAELAKKLGKQINERGSDRYQVL